MKKNHYCSSEVICILFPYMQSAITHINTALPRVEFQSMVMDWTAPPEGTGPIQFALVTTFYIIS